MNPRFSRYPRLIILLLLLENNNLFDICVRFGFLTILDLRPSQIASKNEAYML